MATEPRSNRPTTLGTGGTQRTDRTRNFTPEELRNPANAQQIRVAQAIAQTQANLGRVPFTNRRERARLQARLRTQREAARRVARPGGVGRGQATVLTNNQGRAQTRFGNQGTANARRNRAAAFVANQAPNSNIAFRANSQRRAQIRANVAASQQARAAREPARQGQRRRGLRRARRPV
ncbi:MAG: hypothetical protein ACRC78_03120 [Planktothrix sp.]